MTKENFVLSLNDFLRQKGLSKDEALENLEYVFKKAFEKDKDALSKYDGEDLELADVNVDINLDAGTVTIKRDKIVVVEKKIERRFKEIEIDDELIQGKNLKVGDVFTEEIDLNEISLAKRQHIKQLFLQKNSETEKKKVYDKFSKHKGEILNVKVHKIWNEGNMILDYNGDSIFMPAKQSSYLDKENISLGDIIPVYILEVEEQSKDAQIIATRVSPEFVTKLLEKEIEEVADEIVKIERISREPGFKTKIAVSTTQSEVDPVGTIIGVKGQKIKLVTNELNGERIDVIKHEDDLKKFVAEALLPAKITGITIPKHSEEDNREHVTVIVEKDQFLATLGKKGMNIKLAAILTGSKIDVKNIEEAKEEGIKWEEVTRTEFISKNANNNVYDDIDLDDYASTMDIAESENDTFSEDDYNNDEEGYN